MKKILVIVTVLLTVNSFSAQVLGDTRANFGIFTDKELKNLVFGNYNLDKEVVSLSKVKGTDPVAAEKSNKDALQSLEKAISTYSYGVLKEYLDGALLTGTGFDSKKMKEFSEEISKELITSAEKRGEWKTSKNESIASFPSATSTILKDFFSKNVLIIFLILSSSSIISTFFIFWFGPKYLEHFLYNFFTHFFKFNWC